MGHAIPNTWWLESDCCKYILSCLVHKDNKEISTRPTKLPPGPTRKEVREKQRNSVTKERSEAKLQREVAVVNRTDGATSVEKYGDVDHQIKKARVLGMQSVVEKNNVDAIVSQIAVMRQMEEIYVKRMGRDVFEQQIVNLMGKMPGMEKVTAPQQEVDTPRDTPLVNERGNDWGSDDSDDVDDKDVVSD